MPTAVSTVGEVRGAGGVVTRDTTPYNPNHCLIGGCSADVFHRLFTPTITNVWTVEGFEADGEDRVGCTALVLVEDQSLVFTDRAMARARRTSRVVGWCLLRSGGFG